MSNDVDAARWFRFGDVVYVMATSDGPLTARQVSRALLGEWSVSTIRATLNDLVDRGMLVRWRTNRPSAPFLYDIADGGPDDIDVGRVRTEAASL